MHDMLIWRRLLMHCVVRAAVGMVLDTARTMPASKEMTAITTRSSTRVKSVL